MANKYPSYRLNIFGFPRAEALDGRHLNPAFLDQRKGVEWVYQNIHNFGGNPNQMILFGDSAGSSSVDKYTYSWAHDPLVKGFIMMSGQGEISGDPTDHSNFTYVAERVGCNSNDKDEVFSCMQEVAPEKIVDVLDHYDAKANGGKMLNFQPQADNETSFSNYTDLQVRGQFAPLVSLRSPTMLRIPRICENGQRLMRRVVIAANNWQLRQRICLSLPAIHWFCPRPRTPRYAVEWHVYLPCR